MAVFLGYASQSEKSTANGLKGDQTKREVRLAPYYNFGQDVVIRIKRRKLRKRAATAMEKLCQNENIGYGQADRLSLWYECDRIGWKISRIEEIRRCNTDCSMLVTCALNFAFGKSKINISVTTNLIRNTKDKFPRIFKVIRINKIKNWCLGDMPLKEGKHVAMVVSK